MMNNLFSFLVTGAILAAALSATTVRAEVRCDSLFSNTAADVTVFATHLSPNSDRPWSPFRFEFSPTGFTIRVLGNYAESVEGAPQFPPAVFESSNPKSVSVHPRNRLVAVLGAEPGVYSFADGVTPNSQGWRRIDQAHSRQGAEHVFLVYEIELSSIRPHYGFFKAYVTDGPNLRELGSVVPLFSPGTDRASRVYYPYNVKFIRLISPTQIELTGHDGSIRLFEIEPPIAASEQGLKLTGFR